MGFLATNLLAFLSILLMVYIYNPYTFLLARLLQGICTGIFSAIVPLYINEIVTPDCTNLGSLNQIFIGFAQFFCFLLAFILSKVLDKNSESTFWKIIAEFPLLTILIQTFILLFVFPYETPKYLYEKGERQKAGELISLIYH
jgi:MFS family permease